MRARIKKLFLLTVTLAVLVGHADSGDSSPFLLDTAEGTRIAAEGEAIQIAYSPHWNGAASCTVAETGKTALVAAATDEGTVSWTPQGTGGHTLTHTAGGDTLTAQFAVLGDDVVLHGGVLAAGETWGTNKVHLVPSAVTVPSGVVLTIEPGAVVKFMPGMSLTVASGGSCTARGVIFTHVNDDTIGGDTLLDGGNAVAKMGDYAITGTITDDDSTEYRYMPPQTLPSNISSNTRLRGYRTYIASYSVTVASGVTLTLQPGTIIKFASGCSLNVNGTLDARGTLAAPIVFTSLKDDENGGDTNGDGTKTLPNPGDWIGVYNNGGTVKLTLAKVFYGGYGQYTNQGDASIRNVNGITELNCCEIKHAEMRILNADRGTIRAANCVIQDGRWGTQGYVSLLNCVVADCMTGVVSGSAVNTVFYNCTTPISGTQVRCSIAFGTSSTQSVGGLTWCDPLFVDPDNGDFRIAANSPCVDAGDGTVAPEADWWGQPRMDVKRIKDTGTPNGDGVCPDIGIYEVPGTAVVPVPDLAVVTVGISSTGGSPVQGGDGNAPAARCTAGDTITVTYMVTNRGTAAATGLVRDFFRFKGADVALGGQTVDAAEIEQAYSVPTGACVTLTANITVPTLKAGTWNLCVIANAERDVYESVMANNSMETEDAILVSLEAFAVGGSMTVEIASGGIGGTAVAGLPASGGAIVATLPTGVSFFASVGYVPDEARHDVEGTALADGRTALFVPVHEEGETVYVTLVNDSGAAQTVTLDALASSEGLEIAKPADVAVTAKGPNVTAKLVLPESVRDGRIYAAWVEYANSGDEDAELPIFTISRTGGGATFAATAKGEYAANPLSLIGLAPSAPRGKLKPGEAGRVAFYILSSGSLSVQLGMVTEKSTSVLNGFSSIAEYRAGMSAAATRLCARGGADPDFTAVLAQALNEKRGAGGCAVYGTLKHSVTRLPLVGVEMHLLATNDDSVASAALTDANGHFVLTADEAGAYLIDIPSVGGFEQELYELTDGEDRMAFVLAQPLSSLSGFVERPDAVGVASGATVVLDDVSTDAPEDFVATTDDSGCYSFAGLADGEYRLNLYPFDGYAIVETETFVITNGQAYSRNLGYVEKGCVVSGRVYDVETGENVTNAFVILSNDGVQSGVLVDGEGRFAFDGLGHGEWTLSLESERYAVDGTGSVEIDGEESKTVDIPVRTKSPVAVLKPVGMVPLTARFALLRDDISDLEWDFDGDGVVDSNDAAPSWTYSSTGKYSVTLAYTDDDGVRRTSRIADAVTVMERFDNVLRSNGVIVTDYADVTVESVSSNELVLVGASVANWTAAGTVLGAEMTAKGGFIRRVVSATSLGGNRWRFSVEEAGLRDLFERYFFSSDISFAAAASQNMLLGAKNGTRLLGVTPEEAEPLFSAGVQVKTPSRTADHSFTLGPLSVEYEGESISAQVDVSSWSDPVSGSYSAWSDEDGAEWECLSTKETYKATATFTEAITKPFAQNMNGVSWRKWKTHDKVVRKTWNGKGPEIMLPWGFNLSLQVDAVLDLKIEGEGSMSLEKSFTVQCMKTIQKKNGKAKKTDISDLGVSLGTKRTLTGKVSASIEASVIVGAYASWAKVFGRLGGGIRVGATLGVSQDISLSREATASFSGNGVGGSIDGKLDSRFEVFLNFFAGVNVSWKWLNIQKSKLHFSDLPFLKYELQNTAHAGEMGIDVSGEGLTVSFAAKKPKIEATGLIFGRLDGIEIPTYGYLWGLGDRILLQEGERLTHTYAKPGRYKIRLFGTSLMPATLISYPGGQFTRTKVQWINVFDDKPPEPQITTDTGNKSPKKSCDPNEMDGPDGVGEERFVKPGELITYTVYFENKADADVPAQEVRVTNPLSEWLDWSTFEMREVAFCNQVETGLAGKQNGTITVNQDGTAYKVQAIVALDESTGSVEWYLRSMDPARAEYNYWPPDGEGLLPPNDDTHRGEGHITYRIKVRDDAPANVVITNSASIVFDRNDPIETDPAWWNTVGSLGAAFAQSEVEVNESETATIRVNGGSAESASSVKVYLTYNTVAAADVDLAKGTVSSTGSLPVQEGNAQAARSTGLKFPLTLSWAKGEVGEKVITIPVKTDKTVEDDEFFTLQLAEAEGMELGEERVCTVTIRDMNDKTLKASVSPYKPKKDETVSTNTVGVTGVSYDAEGGVATQSGGFVAGTGAYTSGSKLTLTAEARPGWSFVGWARGGGRGATALPEILSNKAKWQVVVTNDEEYVAVFEKIPYVRGLADPADGGKVSGSGLCAAGKKVTLKATANKGFVFAGWTTEQIPLDGDRLVVGAQEYVATTPSLVIDRTAKPAKSTATSTTITGVDEDATYYACFITSAEDKAAMVASVDGQGLDPWVSKAETHAFATNVWAGVYLEWPVAASALSAPTVKVSGLPSGLKFAAKPVTSKIGTGKNAITVTNVPANTIYGAPTAASKSKTDKKTGVTTVTPSAVKVTVTTAGKSSQTYQIDTVVDALPAWAVGTYSGGFIETALPGGQVSLTIDTKGKSSGKALGDGLTYTLAAPYYAGFEVVDGGVGLVSNFLADVTASWSYKEGSKTIKTNDVVRMAVQDNGIGGYAAVEGWFEAYTVNWKVDPWKTLGKSFDKKVQVYAIRADGTFIDGDDAATVALGADVTGRVTLKFAASGAVSVSGEFAIYDEKKDKYTTVKATGSATLVPIGDERGAVFIYLTPKGLSPHARSLDMEWPKD